MSFLAIHEKKFLFLFRPVLVLEFGAKQKLVPESLKWRPRLKLLKIIIKIINYELSDG